MKEETKINKEIDKLKECVKEKDRRLKNQSRRIEIIESRFTTIKWIIAISIIVVGFILLGYTMVHIHDNLPDAITVTDGGVNGSLSGSQYNFVDSLQLVGYPVICILAFIGFLTMLWIVYKIYFEE